MNNALLDLNTTSEVVIVSWKHPSWADASGHTCALHEILNITRVSTEVYNGLSCLRHRRENWY